MYLVIREIREIRGQNSPRRTRSEPSCHSLCPVGQTVGARSLHHLSSLLGIQGHSHTSSQLRHTSKCARKNPEAICPLRGQPGLVAQVEFLPVSSVPNLPSGG